MALSVLFTGWVSASSVHAACHAVALVDGDPALALALQAELVSRGVAIDQAVPNACSALRAQVNRYGAALLVSVTLPYGAKTGRAVSNVEVAATWIESRLKTDLAEPLLVARVPTSLIASDSPSSSLTRTAEVAPAAGRFSLALSMDKASTGDGSAGGYLLGGCVNVAAVCVGVLGRFADQPDVSYTSWITTLASRRSIDAYATVSVPVPVGRVTLVPIAGLGLGWVRTRQADEIPFPNRDPPNCDPAQGCVDPGRLERSAIGFRALAGVSVWFPITDRVFLDLGAWAGWSPGASRAPYVRNICDEAPELPECDPIVGPTITTQFAYAPPSAQYLAAGLGLRVNL